MTRRDEEREKRLAAALRENLKRRKAQARRDPSRASEAQDPLPQPSAGPPPRPGED